jgi:hypothetical protein
MKSYAKSMYRHAPLAALGLFVVWSVGCLVTTVGDPKSKEQDVYGSKPSSYGQVPGPVEPPAPYEVVVDPYAYGGEEGDSE